MMTKINHFNFGEPSSEYNTIYLHTDRVKILPENQYFPNATMVRSKPFPYFPHFCAVILYFLD